MLFMLSYPQQLINSFFNFYFRGYIEFKQITFGGYIKLQLFVKANLQKQFILLLTILKRCHSNISLYVSLVFE